MIVTPFDTELFGHWWFEGTDFLGDLYRVMAARGTPHPSTASDHLDRQPPVLAAELAEVEELPGPGECFSLIFRLPDGAPLVQDTYGIGHPVLGQLSLFLVPVGPNQLQAVVNRLEG